MNERKEWIISDTHFNHSNIIKLCERPFHTTEEMNEVIIENWNRKVGKNDLVFHLGDFAFANKETTKYFASRLNGVKHLILGNHDDSHSTKYFRECGFEFVSKYPIIIHDFYILSHAPMTLRQNSFYVNLHGHTHETKLECLSGDKNLYYNCCVECNHYAPIDFETILKYYSK
jgi:calcineurin-like phosphoesterase family protein